MACVNVRLPDGHRQVVKVTPNTIIMQLLDEVCEKIDLNTLEYDLLFNKKILDVSSTFQFSGVPNNAWLDLKERQIPRSMSNVTVGLQVESSNEYREGSFLPQNSLMEIINQLAPEAINELERKKLVYARLTYHGESSLAETTLKKLGLLGGRVKFRLTDSDPGQTTQQAHVYKPMIRVRPRSPERPSPFSHRINDSHLASLNTDTDKDSSGREKVQEVDKEKEEMHPAPETSSSDTPMNYSTTSDLPGKSFDPIKFIRQEKKSKVEQNIEEKEQDDSEVKEQVKEEEKIEIDGEGTETGNEPKLKDRKMSGKEEEELVAVKFYLGDRNALVYNKDDIKLAARQEVSEKFFDITTEDVRVIYRDHVKSVTANESLPLMTSKMRDNENYIATCNLLKVHPKSVIRISFPNKLVLQGFFKSMEGVQAVYDFVKMYLADPNDNFQLYVAPPRQDLDPTKRLFEENLVPSANIYYTGSSELKDEIKSQISNFVAAELDVFELRNQNRANNASLDSDEPGNSTKNDLTNSNVCDPRPGSSGAFPKQESSNTSGPNPNRPKTDISKVPNWFMKGKKY